MLSDSQTMTLISQLFLVNKKHITNEVWFPNELLFWVDSDTQMN